MNTIQKRKKKTTPTPTKQPQRVARRTKNVQNSGTSYIKRTGGKKRKEKGMFRHARLMPL